MMESVNESMEQEASVSEIYNQMQKVFIDIDRSAIVNLLSIIRTNSTRSFNICNKRLTHNKLLKPEKYYVYCQNI